MKKWGCQFLKLSRFVYLKRIDDQRCFLSIRRKLKILIQTQLNTVQLEYPNAMKSGEEKCEGRKSVSWTCMGGIRFSL